MRGEDAKDWGSLKDIWGLDDATLWGWLGRCEVRAVPEPELEGLIETHGSLLFYAPNAPLFPVLRAFLEGQFNQTLTTEAAREHLRSLAGFQLRWSLDPTLRERLKTETDGYLGTYSPFSAGSAVIPRAQAVEVTKLIRDPDGPQIVLLHGVAGSGKSGVVRQTIDQLRAAGITQLALKG